MKKIILVGMILALLAYLLIRALPEMLNISLYESDKRCKQLYGDSYSAVIRDGYMYCFDKNAMPQTGDWKKL